MLKLSLTYVESEIDGQGENETRGLVVVSPSHPVSGFGMLREQLADLPSDWNSAEAETDFLQQFWEERGSQAALGSSSAEPPSRALPAFTGGIGD